jgi:anti-anti-sigma regulatory factor
MTLKIEKDFVGQKTVIRLSGRLQAEHVDDLRRQFTDAAAAIALDLEGVTLVDVEVVRFLNDCEKSGTALLHCCPYIREWMLCEKDRREEHL